MIKLTSFTSPSHIRVCGIQSKQFATSNKKWGLTLTLFPGNGIMVERPDHAVVVVPMLQVATFTPENPEDFKAFFFKSKAAKKTKPKRVPPPKKSVPAEDMTPYQKLAAERDAEQNAI